MPAHRRGKVQLSLRQQRLHLFRGQVVQGHPHFGKTGSKIPQSARQDLRRAGGHVADIDFRLGHGAGAGSFQCLVGTSFGEEDLARGGQAHGPAHAF